MTSDLNTSFRIRVRNNTYTRAQTTRAIKYARSFKHFLYLIQGGLYIPYESIRLKHKFNSTGKEFTKKMIEQGFEPINETSDIDYLESNWNFNT